jgi:hypothetical protein
MKKPRKPMTVEWLPASGPLRMGGFTHANDAVGALNALADHQPIPFCDVIGEDEATRGYRPIVLPRPGGDC